MHMTGPHPLTHRHPYQGDQHMSTTSIPDPPHSAQGVGFTVYGTPAPQGSKRAFVARGRAIITEQVKRSGPWRDRVAAAGVQAMGGASPFNVPVAVVILFRVPRPKKVKRPFPSVAPDIDKLTRALLDGLTAGGVLTDDALVVDLHVTKRYAEVPSAVVSVSTVPAEVAS